MFKGFQKLKTISKLFQTKTFKYSLLSTVPIGISGFTLNKSVKKLEQTKFDIYREKHPRIYPSNKSIEESFGPHEKWDEHYKNVKEIYDNPILKGNLEKTMERIKKVCPQLSSSQLEQIKEKIKNGKPAENINIAVPSFLISDGFFVLDLYRHYRSDPDQGKGNSKTKWLDVTDDKGEQLYTLTINFSWHFPDANPVEKDKEGYPIKPDFAIGSEEAVKYSKKHWSERLVKYQWNSYEKVYIIDPFDLYKNGYPLTKYVIFCGERIEKNTWINHMSMPFLWQDNVLTSDLSYSQMWSEAVDIYTIDNLLGRELIGPRTKGSYSEFICLYCGLPLGKTKCQQCRAKFKYDEFRTYWGNEDSVSEHQKNARLPEKIRKSLEPKRLEEIKKIHKNELITDEQKERLIKFAEELD